MQTSSASLYTYICESVRAPFGEEDGQSNTFLVDVHRGLLGIPRKCHLERQKSTINRPLTLARRSVGSVLEGRDPSILRLCALVSAQPDVSAKPQDVKHPSAEPRPCLF